MLTVIHRRHGNPAEVLELIDGPEAGMPGPGHVRIRVARAALHPGDLQAIAASPTFGAPVEIGPDGRIPGFEGAGIIDAIGYGIDPARGLRIGERVAYFPVANGWSEHVLASADAVAVLPADVGFEVAAQALINTISAEMIIRAGHAAWPEDKRGEVIVIQSGAASAVGRIITALLNERGVRTIRLVRSLASAAKLAQEENGDPVIATDDAGWIDKLYSAASGKEIYVSVDGVGGALLPHLAEALSPGGTIISYGALGGASTDIRLLVPRGLTIKGVSIAQWGALPADLRQADIQTALRLAASRPDLFVVDAHFPPDQFAQAIARLEQSGRSGAVLLDFEGATS